MSGTSSVADAGRRGLTARFWAYRGFSWALRAVQLVLLSEILLFFSVTGLSYFKDVDQYPAFARTVLLQNRIESPSAVLVKRVMPTNFKGSDISRWIFIFFVYLFSTAAGRWAAALREISGSLRRRRDGTSEGDMLDLHHTIKTIAQGETLDRRKLLQIYAEAKKTLEKQKRRVAFLSIDIVNSTGMKLGETKEAAERDFLLYKKLVERAINAHRHLKAAWTPDGVMICFPDAEGAVGAAQDIVRGLKDFNLRIKSMKADFALRVGINAGEVSYDETIPMEEMTDRVIDIAGHMQKHGAVNVVCAAKHALEPFLDRYPGFKATSRVVDGCEVYEWTDGEA